MVNSFIFSPSPLSKKDPAGSFFLPMVVFHVALQLFDNLVASLELWSLVVL